MLPSASGPEHLIDSVAATQDQFQSSAPHVFGFSHRCSLQIWQTELIGLESDSANCHHRCPWGTAACSVAEARHLELLISLGFGGNDLLDPENIYPAPL